MRGMDDARPRAPKPAHTRQTTYQGLATYSVDAFRQSDSTDSCGPPNPVAVAPANPVIAASGKREHPKGSAATDPAAPVASPALASDHWWLRRA